MDHDPEVFRKLIELGQKGIFKGSLNRIVVAGPDGRVLYSSYNPQDAPMLGRSIADGAQVDAADR
jgi:hypothetical protein